MATEPAGTLDAAVVQGGGPRGLRAVFTDPQATTDRQFAVAQQIIGSPDLVLLSEYVISVAGPIAGSGDRARVAALAPGARCACRRGDRRGRRLRIPQRRGDPGP